MGRRPPVALLDRRIRLHPKARYEPEGPVLRVRRKNPIERAVARLVQKGESRVRLELDERSAAVVGALARMEAPLGRELAAELDVPTDEEALMRRDPDLAALLVFLSTLERGGALVTEPI